MAYVRHQTLTANVVATFTLPEADNSSSFEVMNRSGAGEIFISHDGTASPANPTVNGDNFDVVPAAVGAAVIIRRITQRAAVIRVISAQATAVSIRGVA